MAPVRMNFPYELMQIQSIVDVLDTFHYIRASVAIEIRINSTQFHLGALMASWLPNSNSFINYYANSTIRRSANHPMIISASNQNAVSLKIPWINPYNYQSIPNINSNVASIGSLWIEAVCPLLTASPTVTDTVEIQVFASFDDIEVAGYVEAQSGRKGFSKSILREAETKTNNIASDMSVSTAIPTLLEKVPIIGDAISGLMTFAGLLDKPLNVSSTQFVSQSFSRDLSMVDGVDNCQPLSMHPIAPKASALNLMGHSGEDVSISEIIGTPMLRTVHKFSSGLTSQFTDYVRPLDQTRQDDYVKFMSRFFGYWRGSMKYHFHFITTTFTSARFKVTVLYGNDVPDNDSGNQISTIVDVKGDTIYQCTVPFLYNTMYQATPPNPNSYEPCPRIDVRPISQIVSSSNETDAIVYMMVWRSAGEDFMFNQLVDYYPIAWPPNPEPVQQIHNSDDEIEIVEAQFDVRSAFTKVFEPIMVGSSFTKERGYVTSEQPNTVRELCKRYDIITPPHPFVDTYPNPTGQGKGPFNMLASIFKYWSGSRRIKMVSLEDTTSPFISASMQRLHYDTGVHPALGMAFTHKEFWPMLEVEVPYYSSVPFWYTYSNEAAIALADEAPRGLLTSYTPNPSDPLFISAGDDFVFGFLVPPPIQ